MRRIHVDYLADDEPVEEHSYRGQVLLYGRFCKSLTEALDIPRDMHGLHVRQVVHAALGAEFRKLAGRVVIGPPRVLVLDVRCEEIEEALRRPSLVKKQGRGLRANLGQALQRVQHYDFGGWGVARHLRTTPECRPAPIAGAS